MLADCESAMRTLSIAVCNVRDEAQNCEREWSPTLTKHVLQVHGLLNAELGFKREAIEMLRNKIAGAADPGMRISDVDWQTAVIANWICNKPGDMLPFIQEMLGAGEHPTEQLARAEDLK